MKLKSLLLASLLLLLLSCRDESGTLDLLNKSEALLATNPDSAYTLLNSVSVAEQKNNKLLARWCMLTAECANKLHEDMPHTNWLLQAQQWYNKQGTPEEQARIGLFLGRAYAEEKEFEKAMTTYVETLETANKNKIYSQAGYISSYMGDLYEFKDMPNEARHKYEEGANYFIKAGNKRSYALALRDIAYSWTYIDSISIALACMEKADSIVVALNDKRAMASTKNGLGNLYEMNGDYEKAEECLLQSLDLNNKNNNATYLALSSMYTQSGNLEKARFYLNVAKNQTKQVDVPIGIIYQEYLLAKANNNIEEALKYFEQYYAAADSVTVLQNNSNITKIEKKYLQEKILKENSELRITKQWYFFLIIILLIICLIIVLLYLIRSKKQQAKIYYQQLTLDNNRFIINSLNEKIKEGDGELSLLKNKLDTVNKEIDSRKAFEEQQKIYKQQKRELEQINNEIIEIRREKLFSSPIAKKVIKLSQSVKAGANKSPLTAKDWYAIQQQVNEIYISLPQFLKNEATPLTTSDIECCYLSFFNLDPQAESILLNIDPASASRRRSRLREKFNIKGQNASLYEYLTHL